MGIAIDGAGNVWVTNQNSGNVSELSPTGALLGTYTVGSLPSAIAIDGAGNVWVAKEGSNGNVLELSPTGALLGTFAVGSRPFGIAIDGAGDVWVVNMGHRTIGTAAGDSNVSELIGTGASPVKTPLLLQPK